MEGKERARKRKRKYFDGIFTWNVKMSPRYYYY